MGQGGARSPLFPHHCPLPHTPIPSVPLSLPSLPLPSPAIILWDLGFRSRLPLAKDNLRHHPRFPKKLHERVVEEVVGEGIEG